MSSLQTNTTPTRSPPSTPSDAPPSRSHSEKEVSAAGNPAGTDNVAAAAELLLSAATDVREIIRLIQCGVCSRILRNPVTLPCGQSLCKECIPQTHVRTNVSWPATTSRLQGFECPFEDCKKDHAIGDCGVDITLSKVLAIIESAVKLDRDLTGSSGISTHITVQDSWEVAGLSTLAGKDAHRQVIQGGRILSTYTLAETGKLEYGCEVTYTTIGGSDAEVTQSDAAAFYRLKESVRTEMDCQVCYALYLDPLTTTCGHTFCRDCLHRILDHSEHCPICRQGLYIQPQVAPQSVPSNQRLTKMINGFWADIVVTRAQTVRAEQHANLAGEFDIPLFVLTLSFPTMPTFLHVFEPKYRLMVRRVMEADRTFGMVLLRRPTEPGGRTFHDVGTLLRIENIEFFPDGRSLLETVGVSRFKISQHGSFDGYTVGKVERFDDINLAEEEAMEVSETMSGQGVQDFTRSSTAEVSASDGVVPGTHPSPVLPTLQELETMATRRLVEVGTAFVRRMRAQSVAWLTARVIAVYGECPTDPINFPWWFASVLPVSDNEKQRLLEASSVRERMKICCRWIIEWESSSWTISDCLVL